MELAIQSNLIVIRAKRALLDAAWVHDFAQQTYEDLLFLSRAVLIYDNEAHREAKISFLTHCCERFMARTTMKTDFFLKALLHCIHFPIKIEIEKKQLQKPLSVTVKAQPDHRVSFTLSHKDVWFEIYLKSKMHAFYDASQHHTHTYTVAAPKAKTLLERTLQRDRIFGRKITFSYEQGFIRTLFENIHEKSLHTYHYYAVLGCRVGAPLDEIKSSYKKLAKTFHPDRVVHLNDHLALHAHTRKFQLLQEAYHALKGA